VNVKVENKERIRMVLPVGLGPECLKEEWCLEILPRKSKVLTFWDTFEWGIWFGERVLFSCGNVYHLCARDNNGWLGPVQCEEEAVGRRRFWGEFETPSMREILEGLLGLRGLAPVAEGIFGLRQCELRNDMGKIVCRIEWTTVSTGEHEEDVLLRYCQVMPLLGYEFESTRVVELLTLRGARLSGDGPLDILLHHSNHLPQKYTLRPSFGLTRDTPAREAVSRVVRTVLAIATRNVPGIIEDLDTEFLHDYRICLRKIRSVLSLVKDVFPREATHRLRRLLGELARETNRLRDLDVYLLARDEYRGMLPPELRKCLDGMFDDFSAERECEMRRTASRMQKRAHLRLIQELEDFFRVDARHEHSPAADLPVGLLVYQCIYKRYKKIRKIAAGFGVETPDEMVHQLRIEGKKLRYLMEFFSELIPREDTAEAQKLLRRLQGRLGDFNDASVQQKSLLSYWNQNKHGSEVAFGLGGLISILYHRQQQARERIKHELDEFCGGSTASAFKRSFRLPVSDPGTNAS